MAIEDIPIPGYVTPEILDNIQSMIMRGEIHPRHYMCDMTAEIAAGAPVGQATINAARRKDSGDTGSIYDKLFPCKQ